MKTTQEITVKLVSPRHLCMMTKRWEDECPYLNEASLSRTLVYRQLLQGTKWSLGFLWLPHLVGWAGALAGHSCPIRERLARHGCMLSLWGSACHHVHLVYTVVSCKGHEHISLSTISNVAHRQHIAHHQHMHYQPVMCCQHVHITINTQCTDTST